MKGKLSSDLSKHLLLSQNMSVQFPAPTSGWSRPPVTLASGDPILTFASMGTSPHMHIPTQKHTRTYMVLNVHTTQQSGSVPGAGVFPPLLGLLAAQQHQFWGSGFCVCRLLFLGLVCSCVFYTVYWNGLAGDIYIYVLCCVFCPVLLWLSLTFPTLVCSRGGICCGMENSRWSSKRLSSGLSSGFPPFSPPLYLMPLFLISHHSESPTVGLLLTGGTGWSSLSARPDCPCLYPRMVSDTTKEFPFPFLGSQSTLTKQGKTSSWAGWKGWDTALHLGSRC